MGARWETGGMRDWLVFSTVRLLAFVVPFVVLMLADLDWWVAALGAAVIGFCVSYIFLAPLRDRVALQVAEARGGSTKPRADEAAEDSE
jgi:hypothetical protein